MKACLILKNGGLDAAEEEAVRTIQAFSQNGYFFEEIRILNLEKEGSLNAVFSELKTKFEQIACIIEEGALKRVTECISKAYPQTVYADSLGNSFVFQGNDKLAILIKKGETISVDTLVLQINKRHGIRKERMTLRSMGANATHVQRLLLDCRQKSGGKIEYTHRRKCDEDIIELFYGENTPKMLLDDILRYIAENLGDTLYALEDVSLEEQLVSLLKIRGKKLSVAESFTGGGISRRIVSVSGASEVFFEGLTTYNEHSKMLRLGVNEFTLKSFGAVSEKTAYEMALGILQTGQAELAIATTGLAGPNSDKSMLPVGLCFIAVGTKERIVVYRYKFVGTRNEITEKAINYALFLAYKQLKNL